MAAGGGRGRHRRRVWLRVVAGVGCVAVACVAAVAIGATSGPLHPAPRAGPSSAAPQPVQTADLTEAAQRLAPRCVESAGELRRYLGSALASLAHAHVLAQTADSVATHVADLAATTRRRVECAPLFTYWVGIVVAPG